MDDDAYEERAEPTRLDFREFTDENVEHDTTSEAREQGCEPCFVELSRVADRRPDENTLGEHPPADVLLGSPVVTSEPDVGDGEV